MFYNSRNIVLQSLKTISQRSSSTPAYLAHWSLPCHWWHHHTSHSFKFFTQSVTFSNCRKQKWKFVTTAVTSTWCQLCSFTIHQALSGYNEVLKRVLSRRWLEVFKVCTTSILELFFIQDFTSVKIFAENWSFCLFSVISYNIVHIAFRLF